MKWNNLKENIMQSPLQKHKMKTKRPPQKNNAQKRKEGEGKIMLKLWKCQEKLSR